MLYTFVYNVFLIILTTKDKMRPDKSDSFKFHRNAEATSSTRSDSRVQHCRRKLQNNFDADSVDAASCSQSEHNRSVLSSLTLNDTRRVIKTGAERISKTFSTVRTTFGTISQKFKATTKRRQILEEGPMTPNCATPHTYSRAVLGRTPTQLYSPFGIETPKTPDCLDSPQYDKENQKPSALMTPPASDTKSNKTSWYKKRNLLDDIFH